MATLISEGLPTYYANSRKLVRLSSGVLLCIYHRTEAARWQIYVKKSIDNGITWTDETRISTYAGMADYNQTCPAIAADSSGNLHAVWHGMATGYTTKYQVWYAKYDGSWSEPVRISTYAGMANYHQRFPSISVDGSDNVHIAWDGGVTGFALAQIWYSKYTDSWSAPVKISDYAGMDSYEQSQPAIAIDSNDNVHLAWWGMATGFTAVNQIWYAKYDGSWSEPVRISTYAGMSSYSQGAPSIAIDSSDHLHIVWYACATGYINNSQVWYAKYDGSWHEPVRISTYDGMANYNQSYPTAAVDASDNIYAVWYGKATGYVDANKIWYAKYTDSWAVELLQDTANDLLHPNCRWSLYPAGNVPYDGMSYVFTELTNIFWDAKDFPAPPSESVGVMGKNRGFDFRGRGFRP